MAQGHEESRRRLNEFVQEVFHKAGEGDAEEQYRLGSMYEKGSGIVQDWRGAEKWYRKAADRGHAGAQYRLGCMYRDGEGVQQNLAEAVRLFRMAAAQGHEKALGLLSSGPLEVFCRASDKHDSHAMYELGQMYEDGNGMARDYNSAMKWYRKAADQGIAPAKYRIGRLYEDGNGVQQDYDEAVKWYREAAAHGVNAAADRLKGLTGWRGLGKRGLKSLLS